MAYIMLNGASFDEAYRFVKSLLLLVNIKFENILRNYDFEKLRLEIFGS
ncbi:MAG: hypothetical protein CK425_12845 [Parachlamydia sp.]|nr:MAG: hypothetical protein CK425_12845 [Parachlamydia sp.]